ncbi:MAG TPA: NADH-quinone oxidoreductase subunit J [Bdellovibrionales bacterium]|nr:NADH-quinone oxidoreductase subunit J [Bdellovibrionales bacterium]
MGESYNIVFYILSSVAVLAALGVILLPNPIYSALCLAGTMVALAGLFFALGAYFVAGVQLIVYAGAVMVLFVMVVMLFDLRRETEAFSGGPWGFFLKIGAGALALGLIAGAFEISKTGAPEAGDKAAALATSTKALAEVLFTKHVFAFEIISVLLLIVIVGAVTLARSRGGTHV